SYPAKLCEAMACNVPVIATATDAVRWMLDDRAKHLAKLGDPVDFAERALTLLEVPTADYGARPGWNDIATQFNAMLSNRSNAA
ncbi:MAG: glycosyltransferase family 4 protein, partial [Lysobacteraceae bacterium]